MISGSEYMKSIERGFVGVCIVIAICCIIAGYHQYISDHRPVKHTKTILHMHGDTVDIPAVPGGYHSFNMGEGIFITASKDTFIIQSK